jgi:hypothetical protein
VGVGVVLTVGVVVVVLEVVVVAVVGVVVVVVVVVVVLTWGGGCRGGLFLDQAEGSVDWSEVSARTGVLARAREEMPIWAVEGDRRVKVVVGAVGVLGASLLAARLGVEVGVELLVPKFLLLSEDELLEELGLRLLEKERFSFRLRLFLCLELLLLLELLLELLVLLCLELLLLLFLLDRFFSLGR